MESNKDEALKCLSIAQKHRNAGNFPSARRFCQKSLSLFTTPEGTKLLEIIDQESASSSSSSPSSSSSSTSASDTTPPSASSSGAAGASSSGAETHPSASGTRHRHQPSEPNGNAKPATNGNARPSEPPKKRDYTPEQAAVVKRIRTCKVTDYYEIMSLKRDCEEGDVKKAYRKLALSLHPDKNGAPGADEAFKLVSKAFQVLSDPQKRAAYDQHGSDPESRFGGMSSSSSRGSPGFAAGPFGGGFDGELSPEDLFNMFFGGGGPMGGAAFGGGPMFTASFGQGGFRTTRVRTNAAPQGQANAQPRSLLVQLLPLFILFGFSLLNALPSLFSTAPTPDPRFSFTPNSRYNVERQTTGLGVKYHVNAAEFSGHPTIAAEVARSEQKSGPELKRFEGNVERAYTQELYTTCQRGLDQKERRKDREVGLFGIGTDWEKVKRIDEEPIESCSELRRMGFLKS